MKDSGVEWIGEIPEHWTLVRLKHLSEVQPSNVDKHIYDDEILVLLCNYTDVYYNEKINSKIPFKKGSVTEAEYKKFILSKGDVILTKDSESADDIGIPTFVEEDLEQVVCAYHLTQVKPRINKSEGAFLFRFIQSKGVRDHFEIEANGITRFGLGKASIENLLIPNPPFPEQTRIVAFLDDKTTKIDELIAKKERKIELLKEQRKALINQAVTKGLDPTVPMKDSGVEWIGEIPEHWEYVRLGHLSNIVRGASPRPAGDPELFNGDFMPWITVKDITSVDNKYLYKTESFLTEEGSKRSRIIKPETLLLSNSGATLGVPIITKIEGCINDGSVAFQSLNQKLNRDYLYHFLHSQTDLLRDQQSGYGQPNLNTEIVASIRIPLPPLNEQSAIISHIEEEMNQIQMATKFESKKIELLKEYRQALISEVVTGKVDVSTYASN